jgi:hypothetical protein
MLSFEEAIKKADEELDKLIYNSECNDNAGLRKAYSNKADWFAVVVYLAKKGMQTQKGGEAGMTEKDYAFIQRNLGIIEGVATVLPQDQQAFIIGAVEAIDEVLDKESNDERIK